MHSCLEHDAILIRLSGIFRDQDENILFSSRALYYDFTTMIETLGNCFYSRAVVDLFVSVRFKSWLKFERS